jgi:alkylation response protein AidB-like acyl-CoA dehydrogenase
MDLSLSPEHQALRELAADFVDREIVPHAAEWDRTESVDLGIVKLLTWQVADLVERGQPFQTESSMAKWYASEAAVRAANNALQVFGGYGYIDEYPVGKYLRDARVMTLYEGTSQIQQLVIGRALTGVNAFA